MDKIAKYIDIYYPVENCNFNCEYCYVHEHQSVLSKKYICSHTPKEIREALACSRLGGKCLINFCAGGETLLYPEIFLIIKELLLEGHYISVVTNGTVTKNICLIDEFNINLRKRLFFKFSFHYHELKKRHLMSNFFENINYVRDKGCSFTVELPAYDQFQSDKDEIIEICKKYMDDICHVTVLRDEAKSDFSILTKYDFNKYKEIWDTFHSQLFDVRAEVIEKRYKGFCYAGDWSFTLDIETGDIRQCYYERVLDNLYKNPKKKINLCAVGNHCHSSYCYACHAFLSLGVIPKLNFDYRYDETRDRDGKWLTKEMSDVMHQVLYENNKRYNYMKRYFINQKNRLIEKTAYQKPVKFSYQIIRDMKELPEVSNYVIVQAQHNIRKIYKKIPNELKWVFSEITEEKCKQGEKIIVKALNNTYKPAEGNEIWIVGVMIDDIWYNAESIFDDTWIIKIRMRGWNSYEEGLPDSLWGIIPNGRKKTLVLEKNKWRGKCSIEYNGHNETIDTYENCENELFYYELRD